MPFTIQLGFTSYNERGLTALDFCRRVQIEDSTWVMLRDTSSNQAGAINAIAFVDEGFARVYFDSWATNSVVTVPERFLVPGDVEWVKTEDGERMNQYAVTWSSAISPERIKALYCSVRYDALRAQISRLEDIVEKLRSEQPR